MEVESRKFLKNILVLKAQEGQGTLRVQNVSLRKEGWDGEISN